MAVKQEFTINNHYCYAYMKDDVWYWSVVYSIGEYDTKTWRGTAQNLSEVKRVVIKIANTRHRIAA